MSPEDRLDYAARVAPTDPDAAVRAIRAVQGDIARLRAELAAAERTAVLARGSLALAREELSRVGLMGARQ